ncbi:hypothetical protein TrCOL_g8430 [Triparma columacea]|uniref:Uncharacterized protein n=1 Tax=Triparma columacea TaxID=722753 RepID=A0A9W7GL68_9STRA|nr:hypothetical protein TrCOL_g8430 [Triparma columacea]
MGMPLFHALVPWTLNNLRGGTSRVYCMIPDYRFGNYAYAEPSLAVPRTLNVSRSLCNSEVDGIMTDHTLAALSGLTREFPDVQFLPWDATVRTLLFAKDYSSVNGTPRDLTNISPSIVDLSSILRCA